MRKIFGIVLVVLLSVGGALAQTDTPTSTPTATPTVTLTNTPTAPVGCAYITASLTDVVQVAATDTVYPPVATPACGSAILGRSLNAGVFTVVNGLGTFDASAVPDADTITNAWLDIRVTAAPNADGKSFGAQYFDYSPCDPSDYAFSFTSDAFSSAGLCGSTCTLAGIPMSPSTAHIELDNVVNISKTGTTPFRSAIFDTSIPTGLNEILADAISFSILSCAATPTPTPARKAAGWHGCCQMEW